MPEEYVRCYLWAQSLEVSKTRRSLSIPDTVSAPNKQSAAAVGLELGEIITKYFKLGGTLA